MALQKRRYKQVGRKTEEKLNHPHIYLSLAIEADLGIKLNLMA